MTEWETGGLTREMDLWRNRQRIRLITGGLRVQIPRGPPNLE